MFVPLPLLLFTAALFGVQAPAVVIVEDDLLFSPDFLEYLEANAPVLERDPTTFVLSAWNDNGYKGRVRQTGIRYCRVCALGFRV